jgi:hypothetical protein
MIFDNLVATFRVLARDCALQANERRSATGTPKMVSSHQLSLLIAGLAAAAVGLVKQILN